MILIVVFSPIHCTLLVKLNVGMSAWVHGTEQFCIGTSVLYVAPLIVPSFALDVKS